MEIVEGTADIDDLDGSLDQLTEIGQSHGVTVQAFDARYVADAPHLRRAVDHAVRALDRNTTIADDPGVEILLYAAGRRQINQALEMGISAGRCPVAAVVVDTETHDDCDDPLGTNERPATPAETEAATALTDNLDAHPTLASTTDDQLRSFFNITDRELDATDGTVTDLVRERVTRLVVER